MKDRIRREIATVLNIEESDIQDEDNLMILGLHSLAIMQLAESFSKIFNKKLNYSALASQPTLIAWVKMMECD